MINKQETIFKPTQKDTTGEKGSFLFQTKTVFPFDLFPDTITIYTTKVEVEQNQFFYSRDMVSMAIEDIAGTEVQTAPFFATIKISPKPTKLDAIIVRFLKEPDAVKVKNILDQLSFADSNDVDLAKIDPRKILSQID